MGGYDSGVSAVDEWDRMVDRLNDSEHTAFNGQALNNAIAAARKAIDRWQTHEGSSRQEPYRVHCERLQELCQILSPYESVSAASTVTDQQLQDVRQSLSTFFDALQVYGSLSSSAFESIASIASTAETKIKNVISLVNHARREEQKYGDPLRTDGNGVTVEESSEQALETLRTLLSAHHLVVRRYRDFVQTAASARERWDRFLSHSRAQTVAGQYRPALMNIDRLALNEDQEAFVASDHRGPYRLQGTAGSGKTVVLLHRVARLASESPDATIGLFTVSRALAEHLKESLSVVAPWAARNVVVSSFYDYWHMYAEQRSPDIVRLLRLNDPISGERVAKQTWADFFNKQGKTEAATVFANAAVRALTDYILRRGVNASEFLRQEMTYIQSGYPAECRGEYLTDYRRSRPLNLTQPHKEACLLVAERWEEWMRVGGVSDIEQLMLESWRLVQEGDGVSKQGSAGAFDHVLVDEFQDFSTVELKLLQRLCVDLQGINSLFLAGDTQQKVLPKHFNTVRAGMSFRGKSAFLKTNLRNTREILRAALNLPKTYPAQEDQDDDVEAAHRPELSRYTGGRPVVLQVAPADAVQAVVEIAKRRHDVRTGILSHNKELLDKVGRQLEATCGAESIFRIQGNDELDQWRERSNSGRAGVFLAEYAVAKGFEFDTVVILDLSEGSFPAPDTQSNYLWQDAAQLYVAITRARDELVILYSEAASEFLDVMRADVVFMDEQDPGGVIKELVAVRSVVSENLAMSV